MKKINLCSLAQAEQERTKAGIKIVFSTKTAGESCGCGCFWANQGGSSEDTNMNYNSADSLWSKPPS